MLSCWEGGPKLTPWIAWRYLFALSQPFLQLLGIGLCTSALRALAGSPISPNSGPQRRLAVQQAVREMQRAFLQRLAWAAAGAFGWESRAAATGAGV